MSFYSREELEDLGLKRFGTEVYISKKASIYNPECISIGSHVRIDDFCVLSAGIGGIEIGNYVHIAVFCSLIGASKIIIDDFCNVSSRVSVYSSNDDYTGQYMSNPMVPVHFTNVNCSNVTIGKHSIVGSGSVLLPGVIVEDGVAIGALSLVKNKCMAFGVYAGVPARRIGERKRNLLELEKQLQKEIPGNYGGGK